MAKLKVKNSQGVWTAVPVSGIQGIQGPQGPAGATGPQGPQGPAGTTSWSGITDKPTTISGYGITDAKIEGGVITLGSNTITPITDISGKADITYVNTQLATKANIATTYNKTEVDTALATKQDTLTAGANIQINGGTISATDTTYTAGTGISIVDNVISNTQTSAEWGNIEGTLSAQTDLQTALNSKYDASNPNGYTSNVGTITGITMNGASKGTSGVVDLGTVLTSHQDISGKQDKASITLISGNKYRITFP